MADQKGNSPPPLLLCSTNDSISPGVFRPVPATASLFPADEDGEADSFLGQTEAPDLAGPPPPANQPATASTFSYFQQQQQQQQQSSTPTQSDPFAGVSSPQQSPFSSPAPPPGPASIPMFAPNQNISSPPTIQPGHAPPQLDSSLSQPQQPRAVHFQDEPSADPPTTKYPPTGPPPVGPPPSGPAGSRFGIRSYQHKPIAHAMGGVTPPMGGATPPIGGVTPASGPLPPGILAPPPKLQYDANRPPPTAAEVQQLSQGPTSSPSGAPGSGGYYQAIQPHWFYCQELEKRNVWVPFSIIDSIKLEEAVLRAQNSETDIVISTNGGRYDVSLSHRLRYAIYWDEQPLPVRRCTWFYKSDSENRFIPYEEQMANLLETEFRTASMQNQWHRRLELSDGETIIMHNPNVIVHFRPSARPDEWGASPDTQMRPRVVKRGVDDIDSIQQGESSQVDHVVFVIHGIGPVCDLRFRTITECVDDFRSLSLGLMTSHFKQSQDQGRAGRVEFLPVYWYAALHGDATGVDRRLKRITLPSITRLRNFTNETILDVLFYTSPIYAQQIAEVVCSEVNRLYRQFMERNPDFCGQVSLMGHSLGSLIAFDLLKHQKEGNQESEEDLINSEVIADKPPAMFPSSESLTPSSSTASLQSGAALQETQMSLEESLEALGLLDLLPKFEAEMIDMESLLMCGDADLKEMGLPLGPRKKLGGFLKDQTKKKEAAILREQEMADQRAREEEEEADRRMQEEQNLSNAQVPSRHGLHHAMSVHVDYEPGLEGVGQPFVEYPQLDFEPACFFALGSPIGMFLTIRGVGRVGENYRLPTCPFVFNIFHPLDPVAYRIEPLIHPSLSDVKPVLMPHHKGRKRLHLELRDSLSHFGSDLKRSLIDSMKKTWATLHQFALAHRTTETAEEEEDADPSNVTDEQMEAVAEQLSKQHLATQQAEAEGQSRTPDENLRLGQLNGGKRIDYVLQEAPLESFNEYLFAMGSHACYWESEDTVLMVLKEVYSLLGVFPQLTGPRQDSTPSTPLRY